MREGDEGGEGRTEREGGRRVRWVAMVVVTRGGNAVREGVVRC